MEIRSEIMKNAFRNAGVFPDVKEVPRLKLEGANFTREGKYKIQGEELKNLVLDLENINTSLKLYEILLSNIEIEQEPEIKQMIKQLLYQTNKLQLRNTKILNLQEILEAITGKELPETQTLQEDEIQIIAYDKNNKVLGLSPEETQYLPEIEKVLEVQDLGILISEEKEKREIKRNIQNIRKSKIPTKKLVDVSETQDIEELNLYKIYIDGMIVLLQSPVLVSSIGLNRIPVSEKGGPTAYTLVMDGKSLTNNPKYELGKEEQNLLLEELGEIAQDTNIGKLELKNIQFQPSAKDKEVFINMMNSVSSLEIENVDLPELKRILNQIQNENLNSVIIKNSGIQLEDLSNLMIPNLVVGNENKEAEEWKGNHKINWLGKLKEMVTKISLLIPYFNKNIKMLPAGNHEQETPVKGKRFAEEIKTDPKNIVIPKETAEPKKVTQENEK